MKLLEKEFGKPQRFVMWFVMNNIDSHSIEWGLVIFINIRLLRLYSTDWKSSIRNRNHVTCFYRVIEKHERKIGRTRNAVGIRADRRVFLHRFSERKQLVYFDHQNVNNIFLCLHHHYASSVFQSSHRNRILNQSVRISLGFFLNLIIVIIKSSSDESDESDSDSDESSTSDDSDSSDDSSSSSSSSSSSNISSSSEESDSDNKRKSKKRW